MDLCICAGSDEVAAWQILGFGMSKEEFLAMIAAQDQQTANQTIVARLMQVKCISTALASCSRLAVLCCVLVVLLRVVVGVVGRLPLC